MFAVQPDYGRTDFAAEFNVSRETMNAFELYAEMLVDWQGRMNLVGPATLADLWSRHFRDSAQLVRLAASSSGGGWLDIGSGAGFPALVVALLSDFQVQLVESTSKKCIFLQAVIRACGIENAEVRNLRVEALPPEPVAIISARACAPLTQLLEWGQKFSTRDTVWLLPKGARYEDEITQAKQKFNFMWQAVPSVTAPDSRILVVHLNMRNDR